MEGLGNKLSHEIREIVENANVKTKLQYAKFVNALKIDYNEKIKLIENTFVGKATVYWKSESDYIQDKSKIVEKYEKEFQRIMDTRMDQFLGLQMEIEEMKVNQIICISNFYQLEKRKSELLKSDVYKEYVYKKKEFETIIENTLNHAEFNKYTALLENLKDPTLAYDIHLIALVTKYDNYDDAIKECEKQLDLCLEAALEDFSAIVQYIEVGLTEKKENPISKFFNSILNKLTGDSKYQNNVVKKMDKDCDLIYELNNQSIQIIDNETLGLLSAIEQVRENINIVYQKAVG